MNLLDLTDDDLLVIAGKLDLRGITNLCKVNQRLRNLIDLRPPTNNFASISLLASVGYTIVRFRSPFERVSNVYQTDDQNCQINLNTLVRQDFREVCCRDFELNIRYQKGVLNYLHVDLKAENLVFEKICQILRSRNRKLQATGFTVMLDNLPKVFEILQLLDPNTLKRIGILWFEEVTMSISSLDEYEQLEQWRNAEELDYKIRLESSECFHRFLHFRNVTIRVDTLYLKDLLMLRDAFLANPQIQKFKSYFLKFPELQESMDLLGMEKDSEDLEEDKFSEMYFRIPNSSDVLAIGVCLNFFKFVRLVVAEKYAGKNVIEDIGEVGFFQR